ncbi:hypothetical protein [Moorena sp. SIO3I6]|uniref:hypothetical protein n=1 Tax=Moorena sp. SIO3I6 TaxID=2607831 RepID=UPI0013F85731|nr:hypothetical protein [Moorena sp. SIO3I6]NEP23714.1 hypothetical protein [Moorena sp. SIO3I6]
MSVKNITAYAEASTTTVPVMEVVMTGTSGHKKLALINEVYQNFFLYNPKKKMTRIEVRDKFGISRQALYDWQVNVIDPVPHDYAVIIRGEFYTKNGYRPTKTIRGLTIHQVFVFWLIYQVMKLVNTYKQAIPLLGRLLEVFTKEDFDTRFEAWKSNYSV